MKRIKKQGFITVFGILLSGSTFAGSNLDVVTAISVGVIDMQFDITESFSANSGTFGGDSREINTNPQIPGAEIGVTVLDDSLYYGFTMLITGQTVADYNLTFFDKSDNTITETTSQEVTSYTSYSMYLGYSLLDSLSLYGGLTLATGSYGDEVFLDELGPFVGGRYSFRFGSTSSLNFDLSYAYVDTDTTIKNDDYVGAQYTINSSNDSLSVSATWLKSLDRGRSFFIRLKLTDLTIAGDTDISAIAAGGSGTVTIDGSQVLTHLSLGMGF